MLDVNTFAALCASPAAFQGSLLLGLFAAGVAGSVVHCAPMCGAFVLGQVSDRMARLPASRLCEWNRVSNGALLPYHSGRLTTYAGLGALAGHLTWLATLSPVLLLAAAAMFLLLALRRAGWLDRTPAAWGKLIANVTGRIPRRSLAGEYLFGVTLGFLPCGLLYAALTASAAGGSPALGAAGMAAFALGTMPGLVVVGIAGHAAGRNWQRGVAFAAPALMGLNAALLAALAWQRLV